MGSHRARLASSRDCGPQHSPWWAFLVSLFTPSMRLPAHQIGVRYLLDPLEQHIAPDSAPALKHSLNAVLALLEHNLNASVTLVV